MTGKIFDDSINIYQDQAKILFDYYKSAAEKIVSEEKRLENNKDDLIKQINSNDDKTAAFKGKVIILSVLLMLFAIGGVALYLLSSSSFAFVMLIVSVVLIIMAFSNYSSYKKSNNETERLNGLMAQVEEEYKNIRRDYKVDKIGVAYVPVATRVPFEDKSFLIDHTNTVKDTKFNLNVLHQPDEFYNSITNLQNSLKSIPVVEGNNLTEEINTADYSSSMQNVTLHDYIGNIDRQVRNVNYLLGDSENISVDIPVIMPNSETANVIKEFTTEETDDKPVLSVFNEDFSDKLSQFTSLNSMKDQMNFEENMSMSDEMKKLMNQLADSVQTLAKTRNSSNSKLLNYTSNIFSNVLKSGYSQYSPTLEAEEIERIRLSEFDYGTSVNDYSPFNLKPSSKVKYDVFSNNWVAEDGSRTSMPFGMHQIDEEIFQPVISSLMEENRVERLRIYNDIENQKREYLEKWNSEVGNYYRDNRKTADELITNMRKTYSDYISSYNMYKSLQNTTESMNKTNTLEATEVKELDSEAEMIAGFELQTKQCNEQQKSFSEFMDRIQDDISETTKLFSHIEYYEGSLRDSVSHDVAVAMHDVRELDDRRKQLLSISPFVATYAEMPPKPKTSDEMLKDIHINLQSQVNDKVNEINALQQEAINNSNNENNKDIPNSDNKKTDESDNLDFVPFANDNSKDSNEQENTVDTSSQNTSDIENEVIDDSSNFVPFADDDSNDFEEEQDAASTSTQNDDTEYDFDDKEDFESLNEEEYDDEDENQGE